MLETIGLAVGAAREEKRVAPDDDDPVVVYCTRGCLRLEPCVLQDACHLLKVKEGRGRLMASIRGRCGGRCKGDFRYMQCASDYIHWLL